MILKARVKALLETSHHEGPCVRGEEEDYEEESEDYKGEEEDYEVECKYKAVENEYIVNIPKKYRDHGVGVLSMDKLDQNEWISLLPKPTVLFYNTTRGCCTSDESHKKGLGSHQYRYTILSVEIFEVITCQNKEIVEIRKARVRAVLETSDHDGYCSGEECLYEAEEKEFIVDIPDKFVDHSDGFFTEDEIEKIDSKDWLPVLPPILLGELRDIDQSHYCELSKKCKQHNLKVHDYRYTILSVQIFKTAITTVLYNGVIEHTFPAYEAYT